MLEIPNLEGEKVEKMCIAFSVCVVCSVFVVLLAKNLETKNRMLRDYYESMTLS